MRTKGRARVAPLVMLFLLILCSRASGQRVESAPWSHKRSLATESSQPERDLRLPFHAPSSPGRPIGGRRAPWAILASAVAPGTGQFVLQQRRGFAYLALETYAWIGYGSSSADARRTRRGYRALSSHVARAAYSPSGPIGDFDYYERMEHFLESGAFDRSVGGVFEPEEDSTTFNGSTWWLAKRTFWSNLGVVPDRSSTEWKKAESFYLQRAIRPEYRWSWRNSPADYDHFRRLIRHSNDASRAALSNLGIAIGNHLLSAIDASVSIRLARRPDLGARGYQVGLSVPYPHRATK